ncbi:hypothetical protein HK104_007845, partial [Borealophlyctis nickersoniae]
FVNEQWLNYAGMTKDESASMGWAGKVHPEDGIKFATLSKYHDSNVQSLEVRYLRADGEWRWHLVRVVPLILTSQGGRSGCGGLGETCTDIEQQKQIEQALKEAQEEASRTAEAKSRFLSNASHELRTPLGGLIGTLDLLMDTRLDTEQLTLAAAAKRSADALYVTMEFVFAGLGVINDILDVNKAEAGMMKLERKPFALSQVLEEAHESLVSVAMEKGLELSFMVVGEEKVWGD